MEYLKIKPYRNADYLKFVRKLPCVRCGKKAQAHHVRRFYFGAGLSQKPHDYVAISLCHDCHKPETEKLIDVERILINNLMEYIDSKRKKKGEGWI